MILEADIVTFGSKTCHLECLVPPLWHLGGPWDDQRPRLGFLLSFGGFRDPILKAFRALWGKICVFVHACFQVTFLTIWGSESGRLGLKKHIFGVRCVAKTNFAQKLEFF